MELINYTLLPSLCLFTAEPLYFGQRFINLNLPSNAVAGDHVFDLKSLLILDREHFVAFQLLCFPGFSYSYYRYFSFRWLFNFLLRYVGVLQCIILLVNAFVVPEYFSIA